MDNTGKVVVENVVIVDDFSYEPIRYDLLDVCCVVLMLHEMGDTYVCMYDL